MKKGIYRAVKVNEASLEGLKKQVEGTRITIGIDVAKRDQLAAVMGADGRVHQTIRWEMPKACGEFIEWVKRLGASEVEVALEPSGTYGDALREQLERAGIPVYRVSPKRVHDAREVYDGVPSLHDAKAAAVIGMLHQAGRSTRWARGRDETRQLSARLRTLSWYGDLVARGLNQLEALLARHWPELSQQLSLDSATVLELLSAYGSPQAVASDSATARVRMRAWGGRSLKEATLEAILSSATTTVGVPVIADEAVAIQTVAQEIRRAQKAQRQAERAVKEAGETHDAVAALRPVVGSVTAAVLVHDMGPATAYPSPRAYLKSAGLNLTEHSSGIKRGTLHLSKRGSGRVRKYLFLAVLRWIQTDGRARAYYDGHVARTGGAKRKVLVALMRKLLQALFYVGRGQPFDSARLFANPVVT